MLPTVRWVVFYMCLYVELFGIIVSAVQLQRERQRRQVSQLNFFLHRATPLLLLTYSHFLITSSVKPPPGSVFSYVLCIWVATNVAALLLVFFLFQHYSFAEAFLSHTKTRFTHTRRIVSILVFFVATFWVVSVIFAVLSVMWNERGWQAVTCFYAVVLIWVVCLIVLYSTYKLSEDKWEITAKKRHQESLNVDAPKDWLNMVAVLSISLSSVATAVVGYRARWAIISFETPYQDYPLGSNIALCAVESLVILIIIYQSWLEGKEEGQSEDQELVASSVTTNSNALDAFPRLEGNSSVNSKRARRPRSYSFSGMPPLLPLSPSEIQQDARHAVQFLRQERKRLMPYLPDDDSEKDKSHQPTAHAHSSPKKSLVRVHSFKEGESLSVITLEPADREDLSPNFDDSVSSSREVRDLSQSNSNTLGYIMGSTPHSSEGDSSSTTSWNQPLPPSSSSPLSRLYITTPSIDSPSQASSLSSSSSVWSMVPQHPTPTGSPGSPLKRAASPSIDSTAEELSPTKQLRSEAK
eukprot:gb/GEZN01005961.1/.p1 GENE.gb/GEZN01005961.1/~~gb/GEZN01005961.1/.p1  ORF type:complete len:524 (-),score=58.62 gb/GEZN01005961.1/:107-1678(-)